jgi:hypothetical protein
MQLVKWMGDYVGCSYNLYFLSVSVRPYTCCFILLYAYLLGPHTTNIHIMFLQLLIAASTSSIFSLMLARTTWEPMGDPAANKGWPWHAETRSKMSIHRSNSQSSVSLSGPGSAAGSNIIGGRYVCSSIILQRTFAQTFCLSIRNN